MIEARSPADVVAWTDVNTITTQQNPPNGLNAYKSPLVSSARERLVQLNIALEGAKLGFWDWNRKNNLLAINDQWAKFRLRHADGHYVPIEAVGMPSLARCKRITLTLA